MFFKSMVRFFAGNFREFFALAITFLAWLGGSYLYGAAVVLAFTLPIDSLLTSDKVSEVGNRVHYATMILYLLPLYIMWQADWIIPLAVLEAAIFIGVGIVHLGEKLGEGVDGVTARSWRGVPRR